MIKGIIEVIKRYLIAKYKIFTFLIAVEFDSNNRTSRNFMTARGRYAGVETKAQLA